MRLHHLAVALALLAIGVPAANARPIAQHPRAAAPQQDLRSPDARDANTAGDAHSLQELARRHAWNALQHTTARHKRAAALAQEKYYSSYGPATAQRATVHRATPDDSSPWLTVALGLGLAALVAGFVAVAVRTRRRVRVAV